MLKIRKGDTVCVISGKDKGKTGKVMHTLPRTHQALVEGVNRAKKHVRPTKENPKGGVIDLEMPIDISNLQIYCKKCSKPARVGVKIEKDAAKLRFCKKCQEII